MRTVKHRGNHCGIEDVCRDGTRNGFKQSVDCKDPDMAMRGSSWRLWWEDHYDKTGIKGQGNSENSVSVSISRY